MKEVVVMTFEKEQYLNFQLPGSNAAGRVHR